MTQATRTQDLKRTSRTNCGYDIIQKGEEIINSLNKKVINSLNKTEKPFYFKCGNVVVEQLTLPYRIEVLKRQGLPNWNDFKTGTFFKTTHRYTQQS